jgi:hypothetical protein
MPLLHYPDPLAVLLFALVGGIAIRAVLQIGRSRNKMVAAVTLVRQQRQHQAVRIELGQLNQQYPELFAAMAAAFFDVDPAGVNYEVNTDEYEAEVATVLPRLVDASSTADVERILREEFDRWFEGNYEPARLAVLAERIWPIWSAAGSRPTADIPLR